MKQIRSTLSLCPKCYKRIPAGIYVDDQQYVIMQKTCSEHGDFEAVVERSAQFYAQCVNSGARTIYGGHFIDVTRRCNLACKYCYFPVNNKSKDRSVASILQEVVVNRGAERIIFTGGEPLLRGDITDLIDVVQAVLPVEIVTNGTLLTSEKIDELAPLLMDPGNVVRINLSLHDEAQGPNLEALRLFRAKGLRLESVLVVIDSLHQIEDFVACAYEWKDVIQSTRIKAATSIWNEQKPNEKIFVSDMLKVMQKIGAKVTWWRNNKVSFITTELNGIFHNLVSWYDVGNVDLKDIHCAPTYTAQTGQVENIVTAMLINEGIQKGWLNGERVWGQKL